MKRTYIAVTSGLIHKNDKAFDSFILAGGIIIGNEHRCGTRSATGGSTERGFHFDIVGIQ